MKRHHTMPFGPQRLPSGETAFRLWAPGAAQVELVLDDAPDAAQAMTPRADGWFDAAVAGIVPGTRYAFRINGGLIVPDPASRSNPDGVHRASAVTDPDAFDWPDAGWRGRPWHEAVVYELHVGCFTPEGTYLAAIDRLDDLVALGITALELMPLATFAGQRGWGYDGVLPYAPVPCYGPPDDLKRLVAAAHQRGLMVLLDVVYNHFGPDGNYLHAYAPTFFNPAHHTPWGAAINFDGAGSRVVRDYFIHNTLYWLEEFHFDGLRFDAVHAIADDSTPHIVVELAQAVRQGPGRTRAIHLVLENEANQALPLTRGPDGAPTGHTAQWNDDLHHALHVLATGERDGYYADYAHPADALPGKHGVDSEALHLFGRTLAEGFGYQGDAVRSRGGVRRGESTVGLPPLAFIHFTQNHDQIGNRALGERLTHLVPPTDVPKLQALVACVLLAPAVPMLFMGEEFAASAPFLYFCDFEGDLARAVTEGRRNEFGAFARFADPATREQIPDPNALATFRRSQLDWAERTQPGHADWLALYRTLLGLRQSRLAAWLPTAQRGTFNVRLSGQLDVRWPLGEGAALHLWANLSSHPAAAPGEPPGETLYSSHPLAAATTLPPGSVHFFLQTPET